MENQITADALRLRPVQTPVRTAKKKAKFLPERKPVLLSTSFSAVSNNGKSVSAIYGTNAELMKNVANIWLKSDDIIADVTFGRGVFWKKLRKPNFCHDIKIDGVDCRNLPHNSNSLDVVVIDPPYRPKHGSKGFAKNGMHDAYQLGKLDSINDVLNLYRDSLFEAFRVLKSGGRVFVKCQDLSYANRLHLVSLDVLRFVLETGFHFADQFLLVNQPNLESSSWKKQQRARRSHSILWVGVKEKL